MNVIIRPSGFSLTPAIDAHIRGRLGSALSRFSDNVRRIDVFLKDINGPRGGEDKSARFNLVLANGRRVTVSATRADLYDAVAAGAGKVRRVVRRSLGRTWSRRRPRQRIAEPVPTPDLIP